MPLSWLVTRAYSRQAVCASQAWQTALALAICSIAGPVVPTGKNRSGSVSRQAALSRQSSRSMDRDMLRLCVRATGPPRRIRVTDCDEFHMPSHNGGERVAVTPAKVLDTVQLGKALFPPG